jgi:hypothetical protein
MQMSRVKESRSKRTEKKENPFALRDSNLKKKNIEIKR